MDNVNDGNSRVTIAVLSSKIDYLTTQQQYMIKSMEELKNILHQYSTDTEVLKNKINTNCNETDDLKKKFEILKEKISRQDTLLGVLSVLGSTIAALVGRGLIK